jgi:hypothetical protein
MPVPPRRPVATRASRRGGRRWTPLALGVAMVLASAGARAQSIFQLYEQASGIDATDLAARALAD